MGHKKVKLVMFQLVPNSKLKKIRGTTLKEKNIGQ